jgi:2-dehydropantoate 2-reductase
MRVVILGAGALGSVIGAALREGGADVTLIGRTPHVEAVRTRGLTVEGLSGRRTVGGLQAEDDASAVRSGDVLVLATKSYDTRAALAAAAHLRGHIGAVLSLQNGGGKDEELIEAFGRGAVVGAVSLVGGEMAAPGVVRHTNNGGNWLGELDGGGSARVAAIATCLEAGGLPVQAVADIRSTTWCKLNQMVPAALLSCLTRLPMHALYMEDGLARLFVSVSREVAAIAPHVGVALEDYPGFAVKTVCTAPFEAAVESVKTRGRGMLEKRMTGVKVSTLQDLERGKRTEAEHIIGYTSRLAARHRVAAPILDLLYGVLRGMEAARAAAPSRT